jgi:hypothetical protein
MQEPRDPELEQVIRNDADGDAGFHVYGDWLATRGHPRGELVALHARGMAEEADALLAKHPELWGELADTLDLLSQVTWRLGFIDGAKVANTFERSTVHRRNTPLHDREAVPIPDVVGKLLDGPGRFLRGLVVGIVDYRSNNYEQVTAAIAARGPLPALRSISYGDFTSDETELNWSSIGDLSRLYAAVPRLELLRLRSGRMKLGEIVLPELRELAIVTGGLDTASARSIGTATWPKLEKLDVMFGDHEQDRVRSVAPIQPLLDGDAVPALRWLGIKNFTFHGELVPALLSSRLVPRLRVLDLSLGTLGDREAELLARAKSQLGHLEELVVTANYLTATGLRALEQLGCRIVSESRLARRVETNELGQRDFDDEPDPDDPEDEGERYAAIYE